MAMAALGTFPFGRPNSLRPMRRAVGEAHALVVGVYPSAFHIAWTPRPEHDSRHVTHGRPYVGSLSVDVEPVVFWNGVDPSPADVLTHWKSAVGFDPERHGTATVGTNGPSGAGLLTRVLEPLGLSAESVAFTDAVPWFFVKSGKGGQAEAIALRFAPLAAGMEVDPGSLPLRPSPRALVELACSDDRRDALRSEIMDSGAPLVIALGQEALDSVRAIADNCTGVQQKLAPSGYGQRGSITIGGRVIEFLPLVHPGFARQTKVPAWCDALDRWRMDAS